MASGFLGQVRCSVWRHYLNHIRQWPWLLGIVIVAVFPFALLAGLKSAVPPQVQKTCHFKARSLSSKWPVSLVQSFMCNLPNECQNTTEDDAVDSYPGAVINALLNGTESASGEGMLEQLEKLVSLPDSIERLATLTSLISNPNLTELMENGLRVRDVIRSPEDLKRVLTLQHNMGAQVVDGILDSKVNISKVLSLIGYRDIKTVVCSPEQLGQFLEVPSSSDIADISTNLCDLPSDEVTNISRVFVSSLDASNLIDKVSHVLSTIGGYEAEALVQEVGGLLASLGRLEAMAPLASTLDTLTTAVSPLISAMSTLHDTGWDSESVTDLISMVEELVVESEPVTETRTARLHDSRNIRLLISPKNMSRLSVDEYDSKKWTDLLTTAVRTVNNTGIQLTEITQKVENITELHTALILATSVLPTLLAPGDKNLSSFGQPLTTAVNRMVPEVREPVLSAVPAIRMALYYATNSLKITNYTANWIGSLPLSAGLNVLQTFSNVTLTKMLVENNLLAEWTCTRSSWPSMGSEDWATFEQNLCDESKIGNLREIEAIFRPLFDPMALEKVLGSDDNITRLLEEVEDFVAALNASAGALFSDTTIPRRKRSLSEAASEVPGELPQEVDFIGTLSTSAGEFFSDTIVPRRKRSLIKAASEVLGELPSGDVQAIQVVEDGITDTKDFIEYITTLYMTLAQTGYKELEESGLVSEVPEEIMFLFRTEPVEVLADVIASILDSMLQVARVVKSPWDLQELRPIHHLSNVLFRILPSNVADGLAAVFQLAESPFVDVPAPIPQLLDMAEAGTDVINQIQTKGSLMVWMQETVPHVYWVLEKSPILPRILAIPYLWGLHGISEEILQVLTNNTAGWMHFPCGATSLVSLFPPASNDPESPYFSGHVEDIKLQVKEFEEYICNNQLEISQELTSFDPKLTKSITNLMENMTSGQINVTRAIHQLKDFTETMLRLDLEAIFQDIRQNVGDKFLQELQLAFDIPADTSLSPLELLLKWADMGLSWLERFPETEDLFSIIQFFMHHGRETAMAIIGLLEDESPSLASIIGIPEDYPPLALLKTDPTGTANFLIEELNSVLFPAIMGENSVDWMSTFEALCHRSANRSSLVALLCYVARGPVPPHFQSPLTDAITEAVTSYQNFNLDVPRSSLVDILEVGQLLFRRLEEFDIPSLSDYAEFWNLWESVVQEGKEFLKELQELQKTWFFKQVDYLAPMNEHLLRALTDAETVISWLQERIPQNFEQLYSDLPPSLLELHKTLEASWMDLLEGFYFNFNHNPEFAGMDISQICSEISSLLDPAGEDGSFQNHKDKFCSSIGNLDPKDFSDWIPYNELVSELNDRNRTFSSENLVDQLTTLVFKTRSFVNDTVHRYGLEDLSEGEKGLETLPLPSYFRWDLWQQLLTKVSQIQPSSSISISTVTEKVLDWISGSDESVKINLLRMMALQNAFFEYLTAKDLSHLLMEFPALHDLFDILTSSVVMALRDLVTAVSERPSEISRLVELVLNDTPLEYIWSTFCQTDFTDIGSDFKATVTKMCNLDLEFVAYDIRGLLKADIFEDTWTMTVETAVNKNLEAGKELQGQLLNGTFMLKFSDLGIYLGLERWRSLPSLVFGVSSDDMWNNSTMILATLLEPLVSFSKSQTPEGQATKEVLVRLDQSLRSVRLALAVLQGGNLWQALRETYADKPVVNRFFDMVEILPDFLLEYMNFFGNYSVISQALFFRSDTMCNLHLFLLDGHRDTLSESAYDTLSQVLEFLCGDMISSLPQQLIPSTSPMIANITMETDAATLATLLDYVAWDGMYMLEGNFYEGQIQMPGWAEEYQWRRVAEKLRGFLDIPTQELLILGVGLSLDAARSNVGDQYIVIPVSVAYHLSRRIADSIDENSGNINLDTLFSGLGAATYLQQQFVDLLPDIVAVILWFPESKAYYHLLAGMPPQEIYDRVCSGGTSEWLLHPSLSEEDWTRLGVLLCASETITVEDLLPLANHSDIMDGMTIDWLKVGHAVEEMVSKLPSLRGIESFPDAMNNPYTETLQSLSVPQRIVRGVLSGAWFFQQWTFGNTPEERHSTATRYIKAVAALRPITTNADENLFMRLADLASFRQLLQEYTLVLEDITKGTDYLKGRYEIGLAPSFIPGVSMESLSESYNNARMDLSHYELLVDFRASMLNLTKALFPSGDSSMAGLSIDDFMVNITTNILLSSDLFFDVVEPPVCDYYSGEQWALTFQEQSQILQIVVDHISRWTEYVRLICQIPEHAFNDALRILLDDLGWKTDILKLQGRDDQVEGSGEELNCPHVFSQSKVIQSKMTSIIQHYVQDTAAASDLMKCFEEATKSSTGLQFRGLLAAVGGLFEAGSKSRTQINAGLLAAIETIPGASASLKSLSSRITVLVPLRQVLSTNYEETLDLPPDIMALIRDEVLLIDVNRIFNKDWRTLAALLTSKKGMTKVITVEKKQTILENAVSKREVPQLDLIFEAIRTMGEGDFAETLMANINQTYLNEEIDNLRMDALMSSEWLLPMMDHMNEAADTLSELSKLQAVMDLNKIIMGEVDPVSFLTGTVQLLQLEHWKNLAESFGGILEASVPVITGSELGEDLQQVIRGIDHLQNVVDIGMLDFMIPTQSLVDDWSEMESYLREDLGLDQSVIDALRGTELNFMELLSLEDMTIEEVICGGKKMESIVALPPDAAVTHGSISHSLCNASDTQALAAVFLQHLDIGPLVAMLTQYGVNSTLSSHNLTLNQVMKDLQILEQASAYLPMLREAMLPLQDLLSPTVPPETNAGEVDKGSIVNELSSPEFLSQAGQVLCGQPLSLVPDSLGLLSSDKKEPSAMSRTQALWRDGEDFCTALEEEIGRQPNGQVLMHFIKPLMKGKIFYTPDNAITRKIIDKANETFRSADSELKKLQSMKKLSGSLTTVTGKDSDLQRLEDAFEMPWVMGMLQQIFPSKDFNAAFSDEVKESSPKLKEMANLTEEFSDMIDLGARLMSCIELQRFFGVDTSEHMLEEAKDAVADNRFLAGIVFDGVGESGDSSETLPEEISYTIRVDFEKTPSTSSLFPTFWHPGPYSNMALDMRYHQGFLLLQEMIDEAILTVQHDDSKQGAARRKRNAGSSLALESKGNGKEDFEDSSEDEVENSFPGSLEPVRIGNGDFGGLELKRNVIEYPDDSSKDRAEDSFNGSPFHPQSRRKRAVPSVAAANTSLTKEEEDMIKGLRIYTKQQPYPCYEKDQFMIMLNRSPVLSLILSFVAFTILIIFFIQHLVLEQKTRNKQLQEVMGMMIWLDHLIWFFYSLLIVLVILLLLAVITKFGGIQPKQDFGVLFVFLFCYGLSLVSFCYMIASIVSSPVLAVFLGVMSILVFNVPFITISVLRAHTPLSVAIVSSLLPPSAFGFGFRVICQYELLGIGANFDNLWIPPSKGSDMTLGMTMVMLLVDTVLFYILALIAGALRNVVCCSCSQPNKVSPPAKGSLDMMKKEQIRTLDVDPGLKQSYRKGLAIVGLRKIYQQRGRSRVAVDNLNLELYEGQIMALLGHNGAGKTTIISTITRETTPTAGSIQVYGHDVQNSWRKARALIGLCPQQSVLFPLMTVREMILYYALLKGTSNDQAESEVNRILVDMGLFEHRQYLGHQLSEGLRRRLCLAIAFVGGSKLIILDEPTSGVDPAARSAMWEVISSNRSGRTILLTTHHLDEAETLADRVAILHQGRLLCVGSPLALKSEYGSGYSITLSNRSDQLKTEAEDENQANIISKKPGEFDFANVRFSTPNAPAVWELVKKYVSNAKLLEAVNGELTYSLPLADAKGDENRISEMFEALESQLEELGFTSLEIRPTSLEDVVIALNTINSLDSTSVTNSRVTLVSEAEKEVHLKDAYNFKPRATLTGAKLAFHRLRAILYKRLMSHGRSWVFYVMMFLLPLAFVILAMLGSVMRPLFEEARALTLTADMYNPSTSFVRILEESMSGLSATLVGKGGQVDSCPTASVAMTGDSLPCNFTSDSNSKDCLHVGDMYWTDVSNLSSLNDWLLSTRWKYVEKRYGGVTLGVQTPNSNGKGLGAMVWYDNSGYHVLPAYVSLLNNARLKRLVGENYTIKTTNHPFKFTSHSFSSMSAEQRVADLGIGLLLLVALTVVISATGGHVAAERVRGERRVLYVSGMNRNIYWLGHMIWDVLVIIINVALTAIVLIIFNQQQFVYKDNLGAFVVLSLLYGLSMLPLFYLVEGLFKTEAMASFIFFSVSFAIGLITTLIYLTCQFYNYVTTLKEMENVIKYLFLIFPPFTFACGIKDLAVSYTKTAILARFNVDVYTPPFSWDSKLQGGLGLYFVVLSAWAILGTLILHTWRECLGPLPQHPSSAKTLAGAEEDKDVAAERIKIQCGGASLYDTVLRMVGLGKDFSSPPSVAVANLFLALRRGECFSLLGLNGAGKTTTFRCVTGDLRPTRGEILINGQILEDALAMPKAVMGYCPQSHALDPNLTPKEALTVMALVRGFPGSEINPILGRVLDQMGLKPDHSTYISQLSGGTKRKVSTALALLGNPLLVLLDEPTTGLDPASRRGIWSAIKSVTQDGRTVLLTSHSMDEVNVLSHRMAIMVNGYFVCMGSPHYLKNKLGNKYTIKLKTNAIEDMTVVIDYLRSRISDILLKEQNHLTLVMEVSRKLPLRLIFDCLNATKEMGVTEYDVSQTTLDEVFRLLTSHQGDGQLPPAPLGNEQGGLPMHLSNLHPAGVLQSPEHTFQKPERLFTPPSRAQTARAGSDSRLPSVEADRPAPDRSSFYDNVDSQPEMYATVGRHRGARPSPDIESVKSESGSAEDSPEEEWTHL